MEEEKSCRKEAVISQAIQSNSFKTIEAISNATGIEYGVVCEIINKDKSLFNEFITRNRETKILEAICDKGCRNIKSISGVTGIRNEIVRRIIKNANLLVELKKMKENELYEKVKENYKEGIERKELVEKTGLNYWTLLAPLNRIKKEFEELRDEKKNLFYILNQIILKRAKEEDAPFYYAYLYSRKPHLRLDFNELYKRIRDLHEGYSASECRKRWGLTRQRFWQFIDKVDMRKRYRERIQKKIEA